MFLRFGTSGRLPVAKGPHGRYGCVAARRSGGRYAPGYGGTYNSFCYWYRLVGLGFCEPGARADFVLLGNAECVWSVHVLYVSESDSIEQFESGSALVDCGKRCYELLLLF